MIGNTWRNRFVAVLLLAAWLLPSFAPSPKAAAAPLPPCCRGNGAHKCFLWQAMSAAAGRPAVRMRCDAPVPKVVVSADRSALHPAILPKVTFCLAPGEILPTLVDQAPVAAFGFRSSRAPPSLL